MSATATETPSAAQRYFGKLEAELAKTPAGQHLKLLTKQRALWERHYQQFQHLVRNDCDVGDYEAWDFLEIINDLSRRIVQAEFGAFVQGLCPAAPAADMRRDMKRV